jgi:cytochrome P450
MWLPALRKYKLFHCLTCSRARTVPNDGVIRYKAAFNKERLFITGPKALSEVLVQRNYDFQKPPEVRNFLGRLLGVGVLIAEGDQHKAQRRNLLPAFAFRHVKDLYPVFWRVSRAGVQAMTESILSDASKSATVQDAEKALANRKDTAVIEVGNWASRVTLDIIGIAGMGRDFKAIQDPNSEINETYRAVFQPSRQAQFLGLLSMFLPDFVVMRLPVKRNSDINEAAKVIKAVCRDLIVEKKEKLSRKALTDVDILSVAIESGGFTDEELVNQMMTFLAAGHETTASAMTWAVYMLSRYPEVQKKLRQEIRDNLPSPDLNEDINSMQIDHLPYLNAVCNEVLRYFSPVPLTVRETAVNTSILGHPIPKGTRVILSAAATNVDRNLWGPDAEEFNPDRWIPKDETDKTAASGGASSNFALLTFLHGPRSCIGQAFAKAEFACLLASWIGRFEFELYNKEENDETKLEIKGGITARPAKGMYVYTKVVEGW